MTATILELKKPDPPEEPTMQGPAHCIPCGHKWQALAPTGTVWLECPACHAHKGLFTFSCMPVAPASLWTCDCGNTLFVFTPDGTLCPNCGIWQGGF